MARTHNHQRPNKRTYYLHLDGSVSKVPTPTHLLRIRAISLDEAAMKAMAIETILRVAGARLPIEGRG